MNSIELSCWIRSGKRTKPSKAPKAKATKGKAKVPKNIQIPIHKQIKQVVTCLTACVNKTLKGQKKKRHPTNSLSYEIENGQSVLDLCMGTSTVSSDTFQKHCNNTSQASTVGDRTLPSSQYNLFRSPTCFGTTKTHTHTLPFQDGEDVPMEPDEEEDDEEDCDRN